MNGSCPTGCRRNVAAGQLMCGRCWSEVPRELQADVYRTWRTYSRFVGLAQSDARRNSRLAYQAARDAALASIK